MEEILKKAIKLYLGDHILKRIIELGDDALLLNAETKEVTMISTDILSLTTIKQKHSTEDMSNLLNDYLKGMFATIKNYKGIICEVTGNAILAYWDSSDHALIGCKCGLELLNASKMISESWSERDMFELHTTIGINTGEVLLGNFGSSDKMQFTISGDHINFTYRLQSANKHFNTEIIVSEFTKSQVDKDFKFKHVEKIIIKGKTQPVNLYTYGVNC